MRTFIIFLLNILFYQIATADDSQHGLNKADVKAMNFTLPHAEPVYDDYLSIMNKYYNKHFTKEELSSFSTYEKNIRLDEIYKTNNFAEIQNNIYLRKIRRLNYKQQANAIIRAFQNQTNFDIPDSAWIATCEYLHSIAAEDKPCNKAQAKSTELSKARAVYYTSYRMRLNLNLSTLLNIYPSTVDIANIYYLDDISVNKKFEDALHAVELILSKDGEEKTKYLLAALDYLIVEEIKKFNGSKIVEISTQELEALPIINI